MAPPSGRRLPRIVQLILIHSAMGAAIGALVTVAALAMNGAHLGRLLAASSQPWVPALLLFAGMMSTFAGLAAGTAIMLVARRAPFSAFPL